MGEQVTIANDHLTATIAAKGAELVSLVPAWGDDVMWNADPSVWGWHAPNLFPIVGRLANDVLVHNGQRFPMKQHGFLRHSLCEPVSAAAEFCAFRLTDTPETRLQYPFAFALTIGYRLLGDRLECSFTLDNPGNEILPASLGAHPGFRWPLAQQDRDTHRVRFEHPEPAPIIQLADGLLAHSVPTPVVGQELSLNDFVFAKDALIFDRLVSRSIVFGAPDGPAISLDFADFPQFGIWSKAGAGFVCLEPWQGTASPLEFDGAFLNKPGIVLLPPGEHRIWRYGIRPLACFPKTFGQA